MTDVPNFPDSDPPIDGWTLEQLLAGDGEQLVSGLEPGAGVAALAAFVSAARGTATSAELLGETAVVAAFAEAVHADISGPARSRPRRSAMLSTFLGSKIALAAAAGGLSLAGASAAAYANALPAPAQSFAHHTIGAPAPHTHKPATTPVGPDASGKAAYGLCTAYATEQAHGKAGTHSIAFRNLATAAGGADKITAYCANVPQPGSTPSVHPTGAPESHPTGAPDSHRSGAPATHPSGPPARHPGAPAGH
jgi:hypothetical protein